MGWLEWLFGTKSSASTSPIPSTATTLPEPLENEPPPPPPPPSVAAPDNGAPSAVTPHQARELERAANEKKFAEGQHQNMIDGVWYCSNCGCPESLAIARRKGPLGDKSQCGICGKYWHRWRKPRPVEYNPDYEFHANRLKEEEVARQEWRERILGSAAAALTPTATPEPRTLRDSGGPSRDDGSRDSTASTVSALVQRIKVDDAPTTAPPLSP
ncbi:hypothetical protein C8R45DRAFT_428316 [Mycena sanguinolenta]|nr:hypothetical protein C8R45DRAFT_428316 [Mycena sanguinolenta]